MSIPIPNPIYLLALDGTTWSPMADNTGRADTTELSPPPGQSSIPWYELNDVSNGLTYRLVVQPCPSVPGGPSGELHIDATVSNPGAPSQLLVSAPNGIVYFLNISNGRLQSGLATPASASCNVPISVLAQNVLERLEDPTGIFWLTQFEVYTAIAEALNETMLLVGRPNLSVQALLNLIPNSVWQPMPTGLLAITDIYGPQSLLRKVSLFSMDYEQASWGSDWETDNSPNGPVRWLPIGLSMFAVHPATSAAQSVTVNAIQYPVAVPWPYSGAETIPFEHHFFEMFEMYASVYCRLKEQTSELQAALPMLAEFYQIAKRMTEIQDRRDSLVFSRDFGVNAGLNAIQRR